MIDSFAVLALMQTLRYDIFTLERKKTMCSDLRSSIYLHVSSDRFLQTGRFARSLRKSLQQGVVVNHGIPV